MAYICASLNINSKMMFPTIFDIFTMVVYVKCGTPFARIPYHGSFNLHQTLCISYGRFNSIQQE